MRNESAAPSGQLPTPVSAAWIRTPSSAPSVPPRNWGVT